MGKYSRKTVTMQHLPPDPADRTIAVSTIAIAALVALGLLIAWLAFDADQAPVPPPTGRLSPVTADHANVTEQRLTLADGRTVLCLRFPGPDQPVSCDWTRLLPAG